MSEQEHSLTFPEAWEIQRTVGPSLDHDPKCSSVPGHHPLSGPALLCDCGAVEREWERRQGKPALIPTPRTDDEVRMPEMPPEYCGESEIVDASFARTLERELAAAIRERDTAKRRANKIAAEALVVTEQLDQLADALLKAERHLDKEYSHTVADEESDTVEDAGWVLLCEIRAALATVERREA